MERWTPAHRLYHATFALAGRARDEYCAFLSTAIAEEATWDKFEGFCAISLVQETFTSFYAQSDVCSTRYSRPCFYKFWSQFRRTLLQLNGAQDGILPELTNVTWFHEGSRPQIQLELEHNQPREVLKFLQSDAIRPSSVFFNKVSSSFVLQVLGSQAPHSVAPVTTVISIHIRS